MKKARELISKGMNRKLSPGGIAVFNLPAGKTCGQVCPGCYAMKAQRLYKSARLKREWNLAQSKRPDFVERMVREMLHGHCRDVKILRFHESGDFYSQEYVDKVAEIVSMLPDRAFYAYTKRLKDFSFKELRDLDNFNLINSLQYGPLNYGDAAKVAAWKGLGALVCPVQKGTKGISCNVGCDLCVNPEHKHILEAYGVVFHAH